MPRVSNFLFHRVSHERDPLWDPMDVKLFEKCVAFISKHFQVVVLEEYALQRPSLSGKPLATIMFDDGYKDNIDFAAEILSRYHCLASFYVVTDCITRNIPTWTYILDYSFSHTAVSKIDLSFDFLPDELKFASLQTTKERVAMAGGLKRALKKLNHDQRTAVLDRIATTYADVDLPGIMMNWSDLGQLKSAGHYVGSHSATHGMLGTMSNEDDILKELKDSSETIHKRLGHVPLTIAYPLGSYNERVIRLTRAAGYTMGLAVKQSRYYPDRDSPFEIPRMELYNEPWWKTRMRISNLDVAIKRMIGS